MNDMEDIDYDKLSENQLNELFGDSNKEDLRRYDI